MSAIERLTGGFLFSVKPPVLKQGLKMNRLKTCDRCGKTIFADDMIAIPLAEYQRLQLKNSSTINRSIFFVRLRQVSRSPIARNTSMVKFLLEHYPTHTLVELAEMCSDEFGDDAPSKSAIDRFLKLVRKHFKGDLNIV